MARHKRASMREGPLADLFRSTVRGGEDERDERAGQAGEAERPTERLEGPERVPPEQPVEGPERVPPEPERVSVYRVEEEPPASPRRARERLRDIFTEDRPLTELEGPAYGRAEPDPRR